MKSRAKLLGALAIIGICMIVAAFAIGVTSPLPLRSQIKITAMIDGKNGTLNLFKEGEIIQTIKLPEGVTGVEYSYDIDNKKISMKYLTKEQASYQKELRKAVSDKAIRIAESDERVQQLITGKDYTIPVSGVMHDAEAKVIIVIGNKNYEVVVNLSTGKVVNVEEAKELNNSFNFISSGGSTIGYSEK